jgi:beta-N-acetylhexosaminidase
LRAVGIDVNCAPLADVARDVTHPVLLNRLYGRDPATVAAVARAVADGLLAGGVVPVLKHLPGYGLGAVDSHEDLPRVAAPRWKNWRPSISPPSVASPICPWA